MWRTRDCQSVRAASPSPRSRPSSSWSPPSSLWSSAQLQTWLTHSRSALLWSNFSPGSVPLRSFPSLRRKTGSPDFQARLAMNVWIYPHTQLQLLTGWDPCLAGAGVLPITATQTQVGWPDWTGGWNEMTSSWWKYFSELLQWPVTWV